MPIGGSKSEKLRYRILVVEALRAARRLLPYSYKQLAREIGFDETLLARYSSGLSVPSYEQAIELMKALRRVLDPAKLTLNCAGEFKGLLDLTPILSDPYMLKVLAIEFYERFKDREVNKILVPETSGITLATAIAITFDATLVVARRSKDNPVMEYIEEHVVEPPTVKNIFYVPKGSLRGSDRVLIVDDIVQTGLTLTVMKRFIDRAGAKLQGVAAIVVIGEEWRRRVDINSVEAIIMISKA
ncbi:MAG: phosphoribosyltransferase family protein [Acidilobaceae archaeon]|jgi:adenine phosphoribosyltransferase